eukprot:m.940886 g.940886  ORF g.940886 m.940886 type:complete len:465 (-) comp23830_c1_seq4:363-1757(-)
MTGRRPDRSKCWNFINHFRENHPEWTTIPGMFLKASGLALGSGKVFHPKIPPEYDGDRSWSSAALPFRNPCWNTADQNTTKFQDGGLPCVPCPVDIDHYVFKANISVANEFCEIDAYEDTLSIDDAISMLNKAVDSGSSPFYVAVGLHKPHMPWQFSAEDVAKHPIGDIKLPVQRTPPQNMPPIAFHFTDDSLPEHADPWTPVSANGTLYARQAYRAAVTGMDRKLGKLLHALDTLGLTPTTAVVLHGDHGWQLGELGEWRKMTNFENAVRVPLIIRAPWLSQPQTLSRNPRTAALVELVDIAVTIAELAGITLPANETFDGVSLIPLLTSPAGRANNQSVKSVALSQYPRRIVDPSNPWRGNGIIRTDRTKFTHMGYSIRTLQWRYTEWVVWNQTALVPEWGAPVHARELYDHRNDSAYAVDFDAYDTDNVAADPAYASVVMELSKTLRGHFNDTAVTAHANT